MWNVSVLCCIVAGWGSGLLIDSDVSLCWRTRRANIVARSDNSENLLEVSSKLLLETTLLGAGPGRYVRTEASRILVGMLRSNACASNSGLLLDISAVVAVGVIETITANIVRCPRCVDGDLMVHVVELLLRLHASGRAREVVYTLDPSEPRGYETMGITDIFKYVTCLDKIVPSGDSAVHAVIRVRKILQGVLRLSGPHCAMRTLYKVRHPYGRGEEQDQLSHCQDISCCNTFCAEFVMA